MMKQKCVETVEREQDVPCVDTVEDDDEDVYSSKDSESDGKMMMMRITEFPSILLWQHEVEDRGC